MSTAKRCDAGTSRPETCVTALGKLLAAAIIVVPLLALLFPELNHRSGSGAASGGRRRAPSGAAVADARAGDTPAPQHSGRNNR
jgi:hypothetical protein